MNAARPSKFSTFPSFISGVPRHIFGGYRIPFGDEEAASKILKKNSFSAKRSTAYESDDETVVLSVSRHYGMTSPDGDTQTGHLENCSLLLQKIGIPEPTLACHGFVVQGGNPSGCWLEVTIDCSTGVVWSVVTKCAHAHQDHNDIQSKLTPRPSGPAKSRKAYI